MSAVADIQEVTGLIVALATLKPAPMGKLTTDERKALSVAGDVVGLAGHIAAASGDTLAQAVTGLLSGSVQLAGLAVGLVASMRRVVVKSQTATVLIGELGSGVDVGKL